LVAVTWGGAAVVVRAPATSANLGPGFDALGLALSLHDEVQARVVPSGLSIEVSGEGAADIADAGEKHLVVRAMRAAFDALGGGQPPGLALRCVNRIPHGRGLGSSAAAIVAGVLAARALAGAGLHPDDALPLANELEGHPDNVAPCLYGGLTIAWLADGSPAADSPPGRPRSRGASETAGGGRSAARAVRLQPLEQITPVAVVAPAPVSTDVARGLLPADVPHADAARNAGRAALLVAALTARPEALLDATEDWLHQEYRAPAMPATHDLVGRLRAAGLPAVVSGAGPSVLALLFSGHGMDRLDSIVKETGIEWRVSPLDIERQGASAAPGVRAPGDAGQSSPGRLTLFPRHGWLRRNAVDPVGVRLCGASTAPLRGGCWSSTRRLGGNVYLPREWAFGFTPGEHHVPLSATPFTSSRRRSLATATDRREVPG
jgi:homoserine kinase